MLLSSDDDRLLIAPVPVLRLHAMRNLQFSDVARSIARLDQRISSRSRNHSEANRAENHAWKLNITPGTVRAYRKLLGISYYDAFSSAFFAFEPRSFGSGSSFFGLCD